MTDIGRVVRLAAERRSGVQLASWPVVVRPSLHPASTAGTLRPVPGRPPHTAHVCLACTSAVTTAANDTSVFTITEKAPARPY